jgi:3-hydroxyisobutyrate dehydrogenase
MKKIAFIGTGVMGASIVKHLVHAGNEVTIHTRTKEKAEHLLEGGAKWADTVQDAVVDSELIFTMVGYPTDVETIYFGDQGIFANARKGQIVVDLTTSSPFLAKRIAEKASELELYAIDAPVSGGDIGAQNGTLSIMCGGEEHIFNKLMDTFSQFGKQIIYQGVAGAGQHTKMCNQIAIATNMIGVCEAMAYAKHSGLNPEVVLTSIASGAAGSWSLSNLAPRILTNDFEPGFYIKHFLKDMDIALAEAEKMELTLPGLKLAREMYNELIEKGYGEKGTQALYKIYQ